MCVSAPAGHSRAFRFRLSRSSAGCFHQIDDFMHAPVPMALSTPMRSCNCIPAGCLLAKTTAVAVILRPVSCLHLLLSCDFNAFSLDCEFICCATFVLRAFAFIVHG